jgi:hypothetical protein
MRRCRKARSTGSGWQVCECRSSALTIASDNLCWRAARHVHDACGSGECGLAGIPAVVKHR